jgi:hypothetical protein
MDVRYFGSSWLRTLLDDLSASASGNAGETLADEFKQVSFCFRIILDALDGSLEDESTKMMMLSPVSACCLISAALTSKERSEMVQPPLPTPAGTAATSWSFFVPILLVVLGQRTRAFDAFSRKEGFHLASHGMPNRKQPFEFFFAKHDGHLIIGHTIQTHLQIPEFAFLSASHTTVARGR